MMVATNAPVVAQTTACLRSRSIWAMMPACRRYVSVGTMAAINTNSYELLAPTRLRAWTR